MLRAEPPPMRVTMKRVSTPSGPASAIIRSPRAQLAAPNSANRRSFSLLPAAVNRFAVFASSRSIWRRNVLVPATPNIQPALNLPQHQRPAIRRHPPAVEAGPQRAAFNR